MSFQTHDPTPIDALTGILTAFEAVPLVALGEAHCLQQEADFIETLLSHPDFPAMVDDIVVEFGNALHQPLIDRFVAGETVADAQLRRVWRDCVGSTWRDPAGSTSTAGVFESPIYEQFFHTVRSVNRELLAAQRLRVLLGDPPIDWSKLQSKADVWPFLDERDAHYAAVVEREVLAKGRRALLIAGGGHFSRISDLPPEHPNVVQILERRYPGCTFVVLPHIVWDEVYKQRQAEIDALEARLAEWPVPSLAYIHGTWFGELDAVLHFGDEAIQIGADGEEIPIKTPFLGPDGQPIAGVVTLSDTVDAYLYLGPREALTFRY